MCGVHQMAASSTALSRGRLMVLMSLSHSIYMLGHTAVGAWQRVTYSLSLLYMVERGLLFQVVFHLMIQSSLNVWWVLHLVILVW